MSELTRAYEEGRLQAAFAVGTAFSVNPVTHINFREREINIPTGQISHFGLLKKWIIDIMFGHEENDWAVGV